MQKRDTKQRRLVLDAVRSRSDHPSADDIFTDVRSLDDRISRGTVYRNLNVLAQSGDILHVKVPSADRYDLRTDRHYHFFCVGCGAVFDVPIQYNEELDRSIQSAVGLEVIRHRMIFEGLCADCRDGHMHDGTCESNNNEEAKGGE